MRRTTKEEDRMHAAVDKAAEVFELSRAEFYTACALMLEDATRRGESSAPGDEADREYTRREFARWIREENERAAAHEAAG